MATETKFEKFVRLAEKRIPKATEAIRLVSQLSSNNYETTPEARGAIKEVFDESFTHLYKAFDIALPRADEPTQSASPVPVAPTPSVPSVDPDQYAINPHIATGAVPPKSDSTKGEDIFGGPNYSIPEWKVVREAYDLLCNITSQEELDKAVRILKVALNLK